MGCYIYAIQKAIANKDCIVVLSCFILCLCYWDVPRCESGSICIYKDNLYCSQKQPSNCFFTSSTGDSNSPNKAEPEPLIAAYLAPNE